MTVSATETVVGEIAVIFGVEESAVCREAASWKVPPLTSTKPTSCESASAAEVEIRLS